VAIDSLYPDLTGRTSLVCTDVDLDAIARDNEVVFLALPHTKSQELAPGLLERGVRVIDLGADFRLESVDDWQTYYKCEHIAPDLLTKAVYGLAEVNRDEIKGAQLIANPGCFPTSILLGLYPALSVLGSDISQIVIDSKTGVSGAGRGCTETTHFSSVYSSVKAYKVGAHQHLPEIRLYSSRMAGGAVPLVFTPHLVPVNRGIYSSIYLFTSRTDVLEELQTAYQKFDDDNYFIRFRSTPPALKDVERSNYCDLYLHPIDGGYAILSTIDNLQKGAASQAVQNMNIAAGIDEALGLT
jgi:N-acetyl-gamma-glutamyl-phosphate reductase